MEVQIREHLEINKIIPEAQFSFRKGCSCNTGLLHVTDDVLSATDRGDLTALVLLDFSKAFDTINHEVLVAILHYVGFDCTSIALITDYLLNRSQAVVLDGQLSEFRYLNSRVPQ